MLEDLAPLKQLARIVYRLARSILSYKCSCLCRSDINQVRHHGGQCESMYAQQLNAIAWAHEADLTWRYVGGLVGRVLIAK